MDLIFVNVSSAGFDKIQRIILKDHAMQTQVASKGNGFKKGKGLFC